MLQQYLPFTVLKPSPAEQQSAEQEVATVLTVYGIETWWQMLLAPGINIPLQQYLPFTVLKLSH